MFVGHGTSSFDENEDLLGNQPGVPSSPPPQPQQLVLRAPSIVAFALWHVATPTAWLHEPGRLYCGGCAGHHRASGSQTAAMFPDTLGVGIVRQHPRDNGCERQVLVHFTRAVSRVEGRLSLCSGRLQLFLSHWPSTTALVAVASFIRYFPSVRLEIHYDSALHDWPGKKGPSGMLRHFGASLCVEFAWVSNSKSGQQGAQQMDH